MALASTPTVNDLSVRRYPTPNARSPNGSNPREGRAVDSLGPTRTLVSVETRVHPTLVLFVLELWGIGTAVFGAIVPRRRPCRVLFLQELHVI